MKKKVLFWAIVFSLLVASFFAGELPSRRRESTPETGVVEEQKVEEKPEVEKPLEKPKEIEKEANPPKPATPEPGYEEQKNLCTLSVRCDAIFENMEKLAEGKESLVPEYGVIYPEQQVEFNEGESVFDVLYRAMRESGIHFEFTKTPMYNSAYIEGIGNLYEFDCGEYSGWFYRVNGVKPNVGCSQYQVKPGDVITFAYTCNFLKER